MKYVKFTEENDWEGETWHFFIPEEGNSDALASLAELIEDSEYSLSEKRYSEEQVNHLIDDSDVGYLYFYNKLKGKLTVPDDIDDLYKGGIQDFVK